MNSTSNTCLAASAAHYVAWGAWRLRIGGVKPKNPLKTLEK